MALPINIEIGGGGLTGKFTYLSSNRFNAHFRKMRFSKIYMYAKTQNIQIQMFTSFGIFRKPEFMQKHVFVKHVVVWEHAQCVNAHFLTFHISGFLFFKI